MKSRISAVIAGLLLGMSFIRPALPASSFATFVGYADTSRPNPNNLPEGLCTGNFWNGASPIGSDCTGQVWDSGAIMMINTGTTNLTVTGLTVALRPPFDVVDWSPLSFTLMPGQDAVFTQSDSISFDGSDSNFPGGHFQTPVVSFTVNGTTVRMLDTGDVLGTFGFDEGSDFSTCGFNGCNESIGWEGLTTSTVVVEPSTLALLGVGFAGVALTGRRRRSGPVTAHGSITFA